MLRRKVEIATRITAGVLGVGLFVAGCSGSGDASTDTATAVTVSSEFSPSSGAVANTTVSPPTTVDPAAIEAAVVEAYRAYMAADDRAFYDLDDETARQDVLRRIVDGGGAQRSKIQELDEMSASGNQVRPNPAVPNSDVLDSIKVSGPSAHVEICRVSSDVIFTPASEDADEIILDDDIGVSQVLFTLRFESGTWKVSDTYRIDVYDGATECPAAKVSGD